MSSKVPASSNVMLVGTMLAFFAYCLVITFQAALIWWVIPVLLTVVVAVIATIRYRRFRRMKQAMHGVTL